MFLDPYVDPSILKSFHITRTPSPIKLSKAGNLIIQIVETIVCLIYSLDLMEIIRIDIVKLVGVGGCLRMTIDCEWSVKRVCHQFSIDCTYMCITVSSQNIDLQWDHLNPGGSVLVDCGEFAVLLGVILWVFFLNIETLPGI